MRLSFSWLPAQQSASGQSRKLYSLQRGKRTQFQIESKFSGQCPLRWSAVPCITQMHTFGVRAALMLILVYLSLLNDWFYIGSQIHENFTNKTTFL